jgi:hypothetical protein
VGDLEATLDSGDDGGEEEVMDATVAMAQAGRDEGMARKSVKPEGDNLELPGHGGRIRVAIVES